MRLEEIDHQMTQITDILTNVSGKLNQIGFESGSWQEIGPPGWYRR